MLQFELVPTAERVQRADLIQDALLDFVQCQTDGTSAETLQVRVAWLCADAHTVALAQRDRGVHHREITGVEAARQVGAGDVLDHGRVIAQLPVTVALAQVAVQVDTRA